MQFCQLRDSIQSGNLDKCNDFAEQIRLHIAEAEKLYANFQETIQKTESACHIGQEEAEIQLAKLESQGHASKRVGMALYGSAQAARVGGVAASILTGGLATPVILGATAAGAGKVGNALTNAEHKEHDSLQQVVRSYEEIIRLIREIDYTSERCSDGLTEVKRSSEKCLKSHPQYGSADVFEDLLKDCKENKELCKNASDIFQEIEKKLVAME